MCHLDIPYRELQSDGGVYLSVGSGAGVSLQPGPSGMVGVVLGEASRQHRYDMAEVDCSTHIYKDL